MTPVDSRVETLVEVESPYMNSAPKRSPWGQPPASYYNIDFKGDTFRGQPIFDLEDTYTPSHGIETSPSVDLQLRLEQAWFWTPEWQALENEAAADLASGHYEDFDTMDALIEDLQNPTDE